MSQKSSHLGLPVPQPGDHSRTVIGINQEERERQERACTLEGCQHRHLSPVEERQTFRPPGCDVGERKPCTGSLPRCPAHNGRARPDGSQTGAGLLPGLERADRGLLLEQRSGSRGGEAAQLQFALRTQEGSAVAALKASSSTLFWADDALRYRGANCLSNARLL